MALIFHGASMADNDDMFRSSCASGRLSAPLLRSSLAFGTAARPSTAVRTSLPPQPEEEEEDALQQNRGSDRPPCGRGWPAFWLAVLLAYGPTLVAELIIVQLAVTRFGEQISPNGRDPCVQGLDFDPKYCNRAISMVTTAQSVSTTVAYGLAFFCSPLAGFLCDRVGRKPVLFMSGILLALHAVALLAVQKWNVSPYLWYASVCLPGLLPANVGWGAVLVDRTLPAERAPVYAWLLAGENLDGVVLPLIVAAAPIEASIWMIIAFMILMLLLIFLFVPETMPKARREEMRMQQQESGQAAPSKFAGLIMLVTNKKLRVLAALAFSSSIMVTGTQAILLPYFKQKFHLDAKDTAPLFSTYYAAMFFMNVVLMKPMIYYLGLKGLLLLAYIGWASVSVALAFLPSSSPNWLYLIMALLCFAAAALPGFFALLNASVKPEMRGQIIGAMVAIQSLGKMCGPLLYNLIFTAALQNDNFLGLGENGVGVPFLMSAILQTCSFMAIACLPAVLFKEEDSEEDGPDVPLASGGEDNTAQVSG